MHRKVYLKVYLNSSLKIDLKVSGRQISRSVPRVSAAGLWGCSTHKRSPATDRPLDLSRVVEGYRLRVERPAEAVRRNPLYGPTD